MESSRDGVGRKTSRGSEKMSNKHFMSQAGRITTE